MRLLIAYDASAGARAAIDDLSFAGLPNELEAVVVTVAELWLPTPVYGLAHSHLTSHLQATGGPILRIAAEACETLRKRQPGWQVHPEACVGSAASALLQRAHDYRPALIVLGTHSRSAVGRFVLGSVSQQVVTEATSSVRVARALRPEPRRATRRLIIGLDGLPSSEAAVKVVAGRTWPSGSEVLLATSIGPFDAHLARGAFMPPESKDQETLRARNAHEEASRLLRQRGLLVTSVIDEIDPKQLLVREAERWQADCVFVGSTAATTSGRFALGSVSQAVVSRAPCSVEVIRGS